MLVNRGIVKFCVAAMGIVRGIASFVQKRRLVNSIQHFKR